MKSIVLSTLVCLLLVVIQLSWSVLCTGNVQAQFSLFSQFTCDGAAVCVGSEPVKSSGVGSQAQCILECKRQQRQGPEPCVGVNYRQENNVCDFFSNVDDFTNFTKNEPGCQYIQVCINHRHILGVRAKPRISIKPNCSGDAKNTLAQLSLLCLLYFFRMYL